MNRVIRIWQWLFGREPGLYEAYRPDVWNPNTKIAIAREHRRQVKKKRRADSSKHPVRWDPRPSSFRPRMTRARIRRVV